LSAKNDGLFTRIPLKSAIDQSESSGYRRALGPWSLLSLGVAAIIGAGIFAGIGNAVSSSGPAVIIAFIVAGLACIFTALAYGELASLIPGSGSTYTYVFASLGRLPAAQAAWYLVLYIVVGNMFIATGWAQYFNAALDQIGAPLPLALQQSFLENPDGGGFNLAAFVIMTLVTLLVILGIRESVAVGNTLVVFKILVLLFFIGLGFTLLQPVNWQPFAPSGASGVAGALGAAFFAYVGFEAMTTTAEESRNPRRDLPFAVIGSITISMILFILVAIVLTGLLPAGQIDPNAALARAFQTRGVGFAGALVIAGALAATTTVLIAFQVALPRVFQAVARDGFLPERLATIHPRFRTPVKVALVGGLITALGAGLMPEKFVLDLTIMGTLALYIMACVGVLVLKRSNPDAPRRFRTHWVFPVLGILACSAIFLVQSFLVILLFVAWTGAGLMLYGFWMHRRQLRYGAPLEGTGAASRSSTRRPGTAR
jgi:basic amino acid/polyamine antiporter, APA family